MNQENEPVLREIEQDFGTGKYVSWADGDTKKVIIANWGCYDRETEHGKKLAFRAIVLNVDGKQYSVGDKIIDTTSTNFQKTIRPFLMRAKERDKLSLYLEISRKGDKRNTVFFMREIDMKAEAEQTKLKVKA